MGCAHRGIRSVLLGNFGQGCSEGPSRRQKRSIQAVRAAATSRVWLRSPGAWPTPEHLSVNLIFADQSQSWGRLSRAAQRAAGRQPASSDPPQFLSQSPSARLDRPWRVKVGSTAGRPSLSLAAKTQMEFTPVGTQAAGRGAGRALQPSPGSDRQRPRRTERSAQAGLALPRHS